VSTYVYFFSFNVLGTIVATNVLVAFVLEAFWKQFAVIEDKKKRSRLPALDHFLAILSCHIFNLVVIN